jgi:UDP-glucose 4-epimerase
MDFVYVEDVARAYLLAAEADVTDVVLNVGSGIETSLRELCYLLCAAAGKPEIGPVFEPPRRVNPVSRRLAATVRARDLIGFQAAVSLSDGLRRLVSWHAEARSAALAVAP